MISYALEVALALDGEVAGQRLQHADLVLALRRLSLAPGDEGEGEERQAHERDKGRENDRATAHEGSSSGRGLSAGDRTFGRPPFYHRRRAGVNAGPARDGKLGGP